LLQVDREEYFLKDVFGFCFVADDAEGDRENLTAVAMKQQREAAARSSPDTPELCCAADHSPRANRNAHRAILCFADYRHRSEASTSQAFANYFFMTLTQIRDLKKYALPVTA
jgi:hypothetical protein